MAIGKVSEIFGTLPIVNGRELNTGFENQNFDLPPSLMLTNSDYAWHTTVSCRDRSRIFSWGGGGRPN